MAKFLVLAATLTVFGLGGVIYHSAADEETSSFRVDRSVPVSSQRPGVAKNVEAVSVPTPTRPPRGGGGVSDARGQAEVFRSYATVIGAPASSATPSVPSSTPMHRNVVIAPSELGPSPGAQVSKEVFAEDVMARRAAYGQSARTRPDDEAFGN